MASPPQKGCADWLQLLEYTTGSAEGLCERCQMLVPASDSPLRVRAEVHIPKQQFDHPTVYLACQTLGRSTCAVAAPN